MAINPEVLAYRDRILSYVGERDPLTVLASSAQRLRELVDGRTAAELARSPEPGRWSVVQILAHLADAEVVGAWRFRSVLGQDGIPLQPFDQNIWADAFRYADADPFESLDIFEMNRRGTLSLLRRVDSSLFKNYGMHGERGKESVEHLIRLYAGHDLNHISQVERLLAT
jgi:hypothetical protein